MFKPATPTKRHRRTPLAAAGPALLGLSLLLTAAPALGAANHGAGSAGNGSNGGGGGSGNVKVHDAATGLQTSGTDNEPQVCDFWLEFDFADSYEAGAWSVVSIAPTGDGSTVASGTYDTAGDGTDASSVIVVPAGHYRVEWAATGATVTKKKTFWVDDGCRETAPPADESPADESPAEEPAPPSDDPAPSMDESPAEEPATPQEESPTEDPAPPEDEPVPPEDAQPPASDDETVVEDPAPPLDETAVDDLAPPADESPAADESAPDDPAQAQDPGSTDAESPPDQDQLGGIAVAGGPTMPDTALPTHPAQTGLAATIGLLLILCLDVTVRRRLHPERD